MQQPLKDKVVLVTGAGRGLGRTYALAAAAAGARVAVNDVDAGEAEGVVEEARSAGGHGLALSGDITDSEQAQGLIDACVSEWGRLDGLVNNAAVYHESPPWEETAEQMRQAVSVNILGSMYCLAAAAKVMRAAGTGSIINASSGGLFGFPTVSTYAATKGALLSLTWSAAIDLQQHGVRVNAISPKAVTRMTATDLGRQLVPGVTDSTQSPGSSSLTPDRIAPLVTYLLSACSSGVTGQFFRFDGERLSIVPSVAFEDHPGVSAPEWDAASVAAAISGPLKDHLQPFGVERRMPAALSGVEF